VGAAVRAEEEARLYTEGYRLIAGVDEVGRGSLAGPVVAAAVILSPSAATVGIADSKSLSPRLRERLDLAIRASALTIGLGVVLEQAIDAANILQATLLAMRRAIGALDPPPDFVLIDGDRSPGCSIPHCAIPSGDQRCVSIGAASIVAKVARDRIMRAYHLVFPQYGFARHKGYATRDHLLALARFGASPLHRKSFRGVLGRT